MHSKPGDPAELTETRGFPPVTVIPAAGPLQRAATVMPPAYPAEAPAELAGMLLPSERVTFASTPHPVVFVRPIVEAVVFGAILLTALGWETHPIVHGHHLTVPLLAGTARLAVEALGGFAALRVLGLFLARTWRYFGYRVVTTNRRAFVVTGVLGRRVRPLPNTGMAGATMSQSLFGRIFNYGTVVLGGDARSMRQMRDPVHLYREFEAVANGVDGDTWTPAVRQTLIP
jgi:Bacterial PH domain